MLHVDGSVNLGTVHLKNMKNKDIEHIIHTLGIPQPLAIDQGTSFVLSRVFEYDECYKIIRLPIHLPIMLRLKDGQSLVINLISHSH